MEFDQEIVLALGSNQTFDQIGPADLLRRALEDLVGRGVITRRQSGLYRTPCFPAGAGPDYVNAAVLVQTDLSPEDLLHLLHEVEAGLGRERQQRWGARTVDIDLIAYGQRIFPDRAGFMRWKNLPLDQQMTEAPDGLVLPHPRMHERAFVLVPMRDVAPDWVHPVLGLTVRDMCGMLPKGAVEAVQEI